MKKYILVSLMAACTLLYLPAQAQQVRQLTWNDLIPANLPGEDPVAKLSKEQQEMVYWVIQTLEMLPKRSPRTEEYYKEIDAAMPALRKAGIDIQKVIAKRKAIQNSVVKELDGQRVRIPGYLLPLEMTGTKATEFLLVPYVGACIHVPPPPPNQIVYVKMADGHGYDPKKIFEPVWVTGEISVKSVAKNLYLVDGSSGINIGYSLQASKIAPYKE